MRFAAALSTSKINDRPRRALRSGRTLLDERSLGLASRGSASAN